jgi:hypothetical protein
LGRNFLLIEEKSMRTIIEPLAQQRRAINVGLREVREIKIREIIAADRAERRQKVLQELEALGPIAGLNREDYRSAKKKMFKLLRAGK